ADDGIRDFHVTGVQTCALPICRYCPGVVPTAWRKVVANTLRDMPATWASSSSVHSRAGCACIATSASRSLGCDRPDSRPPRTWRSEERRGGEEGRECADGDARG